MKLPKKMAAFALAGLLLVGGTQIAGSVTSSSTLAPGDVLSAHCTGTNFDATLNGQDATLTCRNTAPTPPTTLPPTTLPPTTLPPTTLPPTTLPPTTTTVPTVPTGFTGKNQFGFALFPDSDYATAIPRLKAMGVKLLRTDFYWSGIEPSRGTYNWGFYDNIVNTAAANGIQVIPTLAYGNSFDGSIYNGTDKHLPIHPQYYAEFAAAVVAHFPRAKVPAVQVWNEPNLLGFASPLETGVHYAALLKAVYPAVKAVDPNRLVLGGVVALHGSTDAQGMYPGNFLTNVYTAGGGGFFDAWDMHPYAAGTSLTYALGQLDEAHTIMAAHGDGAKMIWSTEAGGRTGTGAITEAQQATLYQNYVDTWHAHTGRPWLGPLTFFNVQDNVAGTYGVFRADGSAKPAVAALTAKMAAIP